MDRLWTPWRYAYITGKDVQGEDGKVRRKGVPASLNNWPADEDRKCVFCNMIAAMDYAIGQGMPQEQAEAAVYVVARGATCFVCLNAFPYGTGHVLIVPYAHTDTLAKLDAASAQEMMQTAQRVDQCLREVYQPEGLNFGLNLGKSAGAGIADHLHMHALPRWLGDTNFMTVVGETRVLPEALNVTWSKLRSAFQQ